MKQRAWVSASGRGWGRVGFALCMFASVASAQEPPAEPPVSPVFAPLSAELWAELDGYIASALIAFDVPGAAVALIQNGQVERVGTYGVLAVDDPAPVDGETRFMIGSVTKSMTTALAAALVASTVPIGFERFALPVAPAGAVWASIADMGRYFAMHLREGESVDGVRVVPAAELAETHTAQTVLDGSTGYGLGWGVSDTANGPLLAHAGGTAGFTSQLLGLTSLDFGMVILTNSADGVPFIGAVNRRLTDLAFGLPLRGDEDLRASIAEQKAAFAELIAALGPVAAESVADYLGRYERRLTVAHEADALLIDTVYGTLRFQSVPGLDGLFVCTTNFFVGVLAQLQTDEQGRATLSLGFGLEDGALVDALVAARLGAASAPHHPVRHRGHQRAGDGQHAFDWRKLSNARRWSSFRHHLNTDRRDSAPALQ